MFKYHEYAQKRSSMMSLRFYVPYPSQSNVNQSYTWCESYNMLKCKCRAQINAFHIETTFLSSHEAGDASAMLCYVMQWNQVDIM